MKTLVAMIASGLITVLLMRVLPWWCCGVVAFLVCMIFRLRPGQAFLAGLVGVGLAWGSVAGWIDVHNNGVLSTRIGQLFGGISSMLVVILTGMIGGIVGGFGGMTGGALSSLLWKTGK
jgi:hypothetical protein